MVGSLSGVCAKLVGFDMVFLPDVEALATRYRERHAATGLRFGVRKVISTRVE